ncbi:MULTISPECIES: hypothetical protein [unclassified Azospirillum]|uniref:hypothetical protein n=1 Tax=unclassified Azospirillum TaxID=2630922 RepID=UPI000B68C13B|nr:MULTISPECIES: hypothetical protein [unclassified Azospirillum]SNS70939.1 hypothetical protein SAMN05880556_11037 [Azospirillum sp. RU38E]SNS89148.1 hypothetical protein SAMN05880591_11037 [Azospirillum sp. RU37A]
MSSSADRILQGLQEALAHAKGEDVPGLVVHVPETVDVAAVRRQKGLSQDTAPDRIGVSSATLRD